MVERFAHALCSCARTMPQLWPWIPLFSRQKALTFSLLRGFCNFLIGFSWTQNAALNSVISIVSICQGNIQPWIPRFSRQKTLTFTLLRFFFTFFRFDQCKTVFLSTLKLYGHISAKHSALDSIIFKIEDVNFQSDAIFLFAFCTAIFKFKYRLTQLDHEKHVFPSYFIYRIIRQDSPAVHTISGQLISQ